jgi:hypothetical protein
MAKLDDLLATIGMDDRGFIGTIAFKNEQITLPDGSTIALGIDDSHWVLIYQKERKAPFVVYDYDGNTELFRVDKAPGNEKQLTDMKRLIRYFFAHAQTEDLVTITPQRGEYE